MKYIQLIILFLFYSCIPSFGQKCVVSNPEMNVIYLNWHNLIDVIIEGRYCKDLLVKTDNGTIERAEFSCRYTIIPAKAGIANIIVLEKRTKRLLQKIEYRVKTFPAPVAVVANQSGGEINKKLLAVQLGLIAKNIDVSSSLVVTSYNVHIISADIIAFSKGINGNKFSDELKKAIEKLKTGDRVIFSDIRYKGISNVGYLQPIEFRIEE